MAFATCRPIEGNPPTHYSKRGLYLTFETAQGNSAPGDVIIMGTFSELDPGEFSAEEVAARIVEPNDGAQVLCCGCTSVATCSHRGDDTWGLVRG